MFQLAGHQRFPGVGAEVKGLGGALMNDERERETQRVREVFGADAEAVLVLRASAGLGKTYLLERVASCFSEAVLVRANPTEAAWRYSGISAVLASLGRPETVRLAIDAWRHTDDEFLAAQELLRLIIGFKFSSRLIIIDDADLMDRASQAMLGFLARRLKGTGLSLLLSVKESCHSGPFQALPELGLRELPAEEILAVGQALAKPGTVPSVVQIVAGISTGNPAFLREGLEALAEGERTGRDPLSYPVHFGPRAAHETECFFRELTVEAQEVVRLASTAPVHLERALRDVLGDRQHALEALIQDRVLVRSGDFIRTRQAVFRCMLYLSLETAERQELHAALAQSHRQCSSSLEQWHASFLIGTQKCPRAMVETAIGLIGRADAQLSTAYVDRAIILARSEREDIAAPLCDLAQAMVEMGELNYAEYYLRWALDFSLQEHDRIRIVLERVRLRFCSKMELNSREVSGLVRLSKRAEPELTMRLLALLVFLHVECWEIHQAKRLLGMAGALLDRVGPETAEIYAHVRSLLSVIDGNPGSALEAFEGLSVDNLSSRELPLVVRLGRMLSYAEYYDQARTIFEAVLRLSPEPTPFWLETTKVMLAHNEIRAGQFSRAMELIEGLHATREVRQLHTVAVEGLRAWYWLAKGQPERAEEHIDRVLHGHGGSRTPRNVTRVALLRGHAALARGEYELALRELNRVLGPRGARFSPVFLRYEADLIESLVALGRVTEARKVLAELEERVRKYPSNWGSVAVARCRAMVAEGQLSLELYRQAVRIARAVGTDYDYARTLMNYGDRLRQFGYVAQGEEQQLRSRALTEEIGAMPWPALDRPTDALSAEVRRSGQGHGTPLPGTACSSAWKSTAISAEPAVPGMDTGDIDLSSRKRHCGQMAGDEGLTPAERQVVIEVIQGRRNKEIAELLGLSLRAVEARLTNVYRKTGAQSRTQLVAMLNDASTRPAPDSVTGSATLDDYSAPGVASPNLVYFSRQAQRRRSGFSGGH